MARSRPALVRTNWVGRIAARSIAPLALAVACGAADLAVAGDAEAPAAAGASVDANEFFGKLVHRYRGLTLYQDSVRLAHRTVAGPQEATTKDAPPTDVGPADGAASAARERRGEQLLGVLISGSLLDVSSSNVGAGASCDTRDASPVSRLALARQLWTLPHLALRFADEPLRSMQGGDDCGSLVPTRVESVTINERQFLRLHLESERSGSVAPNGRCDETTVDLFVNPTSMLVERVEQRHELGEGMRYEATLEIMPSRAMDEPIRQDPVREESITPPTAAPAPTPAAETKRGPLAGPTVGCE